MSSGTSRLRSIIRSTVSLEALNWVQVEHFAGHGDLVGRLIVEEKVETAI